MAKKKRKTKRKKNPLRFTKKDRITFRKLFGKNPPKKKTTKKVVINPFGFTKKDRFKLKK